jgi:hypothetical protein
MQKRDEIFINFTPLLCMLFVCMLYDVVFADPEYFSMQSAIASTSRQPEGNGCLHFFR